MNMRFLKKQQLFCVVFDVVFSLSNKLSDLVFCLFYFSEMTYRVNNIIIKQLQCSQTEFPAEAVKISGTGRHT